ncbi:MAG: NAD(P)-dependent oxidoreductase [Candidatus Hodarchaeales archaeon]
MLNDVKMSSHVNETTVLFTWNVRDGLKKYLTENLLDLSVKLIFPLSASEEEFTCHAPIADIIVGWRPTKMLLISAKKLKLFINPGAGVQHLIELFKEFNETRTVLLANGHGNSYFTAQHAVALLLALTNKVCKHHSWMINGKWRTGDSDAISTPLKNRKVGLLGYGAVNQKVHRFLSGFDLDFSVLRRNWDKQTASLPTPVRKFDENKLHSFLEEINILIIAIPLTTQTKGLIKAEEIELLGQEGLLVNLGRGDVVDELSLFTALKEKTIAGAAVDVWYNYRPEPDQDGRKYPFKYPFHTLNNIVLSPHRGASPMNDLERWNEVIENIRRCTLGRNDFLNIVNLQDEY